MSAIELLEPFLEKGIRNTNFFNGRLLSAEDLRAEQEANRQQHQQLGRAIGEGIAYGLEVHKVTGTSPPSGPTAPLVRVSAGLALNRRGQALFLPSEIELALVREKETLAAGAGLFAPCDPPQATSVLTGTGVYMLVLAPASGFEGRAPVSGLGGNGATGGGCGSRFAVEGVQFRLVSLPVSSMPGISPMLRVQLTQLMASGNVASLAKLRNLLAHVCFGSEELKEFFRDPFKRVNNTPLYTTYGALDALRAIGSLSDCDVPLALLYWATQGIQFVDMWSVRRRLTRRAVTESWPLLVGDRRVSEAEAIFSQFDDHIQDMRTNETNLGAIVALQRFGYLPPVGVLPVVGTASPAGFNPHTFFGALASKDVAMLDGSLLRSLLHDALYHEPIDLSSVERIQLYWIRENRQAIAQQQTAQLVLVFASPTLSYRGVARFGYAQWGLSRFTPAVI